MVGVKPNVSVRACVRVYVRVSITNDFNTYVDPLGY